VLRGDDHQVAAHAANLHSRDDQRLRVNQPVHREVEQLAESRRRHGGRRQRRLARVPAGAIGVVVLRQHVHGGGRLGLLGEHRRGSQRGEREAEQRHIT
jgi:hypothetical protein